MDFELTSEQRQLEREVNDYLKKVISPELEEEIFLDRRTEDGKLNKQILRRLGADGWLGIGWPREYGGQGRSPLEQYIFINLAKGYYGIPISTLALNTVGPTIMRVGTEAQKKRFLPAILRGELEISIGYTEPEAGTDLASLKTKAVRDGDDYIINGQKVYTSNAQFCDYIWLAARTNPDVPKHKGISIFLVDKKTPGITVTPIWIMGGFRTNHTFYDNVRVPKESLIGEENQGWRYMGNQLALERIQLVPHSYSLRWIEDVTGWAKQHKLNGLPVIEQSWVKDKLVQMAVEAEVLKLLNYRVAWLLTQGIVPHNESAMIKVFGTELNLRILGDCMRIMGLYGQLERGSKWASFQGKLVREFQHKVVDLFGGGANDALKDLVATAGLGLPRSR